jgi:hypothetical protein
MGHEEDILEETQGAGLEVAIDPNRELNAVLDDLTDLLKSGEVIGALTARGLNASLALVAATGLRAYLAGQKLDAADDFATVAEEIRGRAGLAGLTGGTSGHSA